MMVRDDGLRLPTELPVLTAGDLLLRPLTPADAGAIGALFGDPEVVRYMSLRRISSDEEARDFIAALEPAFRAGSLYQWGIELHQEIVGTCTLAQIDHQHRRAELGYAVRRRFWGRRVLSRALPSLVEFAFGELNMHRLEADSDPRNLASRRALERLGFRHEGLLRERYLQGGEAQDAMVFGLLRTEWQRARAR